MKPSLATQLVLAGLLVPATFSTAEEPSFAEAPARPAPASGIRLILWPRAGFNISAHFESTGAGNFQNRPRTTPSGDAYNYDDGYVLTDVSGNAGGQTWYWGYDDNPTQISGNTILLNRSTVNDAATSLTQDADLSVGAELAGQLQLGSHGRWSHGLEAGVAYQKVDVSAAGTSLATIETLTEAYSFAPGANPPGATPSSPYQGTFQGPGFMISDTPSSSSTVTTPNVPFVTKNELRSTLWGFRLGPYLEYALAERFAVGVSAGVAAGVLNADVSWSDRAGGSIASGSGTDLGVLMGFYVGGTAAWQFSDHWSLFGGVQYQNLGTYEHDFDGRMLQLDFNSAFYTAIGLGCRF